jgi:hypothetical protein
MPSSEELFDMVKNFNQDDENNRDTTYLHFQNFDNEFWDNDITEDEIRCCLKKFKKLKKNRKHTDWIMC